MSARILVGFGGGLPLDVLVSRLAKMRSIKTTLAPSVAASAGVRDTMTW